MKFIHAKYSLKKLKSSLFQLPTEQKFLDMNLRDYLEKMKQIQEKLIDYLEDMEENKTLINIFEDNQFHDKYELISLLYFVSKISNNHHRDDNFSNKIEGILLFFKEDIKTKITNSELFHIFQSNLKNLLFLYQEGMLTFDDQIVKKIVQGKYADSYYPEYFLPELRSFITEEWLKKNNLYYLTDRLSKEIPNDFIEKRKKGENDHFICELIRKDSIDDFIRYVNQNQYKLNSNIEPSIYETNKFLIKNKYELTLIEYAVFFGSIQIFNYLRLNKVNLKPSLWLYAIHSKNADIIHLLEENNIKPNDESYKECFIESIKCHHNDIANYIFNQYLLDEKDISKDILVNILKYNNLHFGQNDLIDKSSFFYLCQYDYYVLARILSKEKDIDINIKIIYTKSFNSILM